MIVRERTACHAPAPRGRSPAVGEVIVGFAGQYLFVCIPIGIQVDPGFPGPLDQLREQPGIAIIGQDQVGINALQIGFQSD